MLPQLQAASDSERGARERAKPMNIVKWLQRPSATRFVSRDFTLNKGSFREREHSFWFCFVIHVGALSDGKHNKNPVELAVSVSTTDNESKYLTCDLQLQNSKRPKKGDETGPLGPSKQPQISSEFRGTRTQ